MSDCGYYYLWTIGCQMNVADSRRLAGELEALGYRPVQAPEQADVVVLNTCVVRQQPENKARNRIAALRTLRAKRPEMILAVMGCLPGHSRPAALGEQFPFVDFFLPPSDPSVLLNRLRERAGDTGIRRNCGTEITEPIKTGPTAFVPAVLGCSFGCAYCVIPGRRGPERSRPPQEILAEIRKLCLDGAVDITLLGQIIDRYGRDLRERTDLSLLLRQAARVEGLLRLRFLTSHPCWFDERLLETVAAEPRICPHLEIAVQSGNDEVLRRMRRGYSARKFRRLVARIRSLLPEAAIHTDIIVGFPGETRAQFEDTRRLLEEIRCDMVHIARYSERPGTYAADNYPDDVPEEEKELRRRELEELQSAIQQKKNAALLNRTVEVLVEEHRRNDAVGRTPGNRLVFFEDREAAPGEIRKVRIRHAGPFSLRGSPL